MIHQNVLETIGRTPLVRIGRLVGKDDATLIAKLESFNPCGSVKDRIGLSMIEAAKKDGSLKPGMTIVEPASGNTGIALAMVAAVKGYKCVLTIEEIIRDLGNLKLDFFVVGMGTGGTITGAGRF
jgi:cysteine synthase A